MKIERIKDKDYRLPDSLTKFQKEMYVHLINYKWNKLKISEPGIYIYKGQEIFYDAILPKSVHGSYPLIYSKILDDLKAHQENFPFKLHTHFNHMASSQAANVNLFLPLLLSEKANQVFQLIKPDFKELNTLDLYKGFQIEYWDGSGKDIGLLGDHNARSGTDADMGISYINHNNEKCLWLIEHKLTEQEFTQCGGAKSPKRARAIHLCENRFTDIVANKSNCYYHDVRKSNYWDITAKHQSFFVNHKQFRHCPFKGGMNQLWRNQILGLALEDEGKYKHVYFSVVHHPRNKALNKSIEEYKLLVDNNPKFSVFQPNILVDATRKQQDKSLNYWADWYEEMYMLKSR